MRRLLVIESPYAGDVAANVQFCENVCRYAVEQGYAPFASHLLYTRFLDDTVPAERAEGIECGLAWAGAAPADIWFCLRPGEQPTRGMKYARHRYIVQGRAFIFKRFTHEGEFIADEERHEPFPRNWGAHV
jgi:hypothetical protein